MSSDDEVIQVEGFGLKGRVLGKRLISDRSFTLLLLILVGLLGYQHHTTSAESLQKVLEATAENTYVLSLSQAEREKLNIAMPESLRRKIKHQRD